LSGGGFGAYLNFCRLPGFHLRRARIQ